jgi:hypothetical protein
VIQFSKSETERKVIGDVADAYQRVVNGTAENVDWSKLRSVAAHAAYAAAADAVACADGVGADAAHAAHAAAAAAHAVTADDAAACAYAADAAAAAVVVVASAHVTAAAAKQEEWRNAQADKLLELMSSGKPIAHFVKS